MAAIEYYAHPFSPCSRVAISILYLTQLRCDSYRQEVEHE